ncbi:hypothetical protein [Pseudonocardia sp. TMWB2A]|uniref:hypothetical protein n=1 Tax=Pseudonocardia sp. TMWB2A TaxID=687430 RepID=UPI00307D7D19
MKPLSALLLASATALATPASAPLWANAPTGLTDDRNARDLDLLLGWFEGVFDNDLQIWFETDPRSATPADARHARFHAVHKRLPDSLLGLPAFHVVETRGDAVLADHVVAFQTEKPRDGIRLRYFRINGKNSEGAALTSSQLTLMPDCDVLLERRGAQVEGRTLSSGCALAGGSAARAVRETLWIGPDVYTRLRTPVGAASTPARASLGPVAFYKARPFDCSVDMFADSYLKRSPNDRSYSFKGRHDLGDMMQVESPRDGKRYQLQLRRQRYPYYRSGGEFLLLRLREVGAPSSVAIVTTDTANENITLNLGWVAASCNARKDDRK